ncbi:myocilin isoform X1 [Alosa pseudoharengus]|uniref:myocilin isoform X1 n=1 Tax=Alosa pseudoharengus TaxID=34774 RepID=UPI003F89B27B
MLSVATLLCVSCLLLGARGQDRAAMWRGNDRSGRCQYTFTVSSPTEASCPTQAGGPEMDALKSRLSLLEVMVTRLAGGEASGAVDTAAGGPGAGAVQQQQQQKLQEAYSQAMGEKAQLRREKDNLDRQVQDLQRRLEESRQEAERLRSRPCVQTPPAPSAPQQDSGLRPAGGPSVLSRLVPSGQTGSLRDPSWHYGSPGYQELKAEVTEVPVPTPAYIEVGTGCGELVAIGEPVTHRKADTIAGKYGVWMQDPEAVAPYGAGMVWRIDTVGSEVRQLFGYEDTEQLARGYPTKVLLLPEAVESTGATMYRGSLYYQRRRSRTLLRYDLSSESIAARRDLPHAGFHGQFPYSWGGYTDIDLAVDEQGLWAIYSTNKAKGAIVIAKLDPHSLEVLKTWETNIRKVTAANAFMICGRLYTVASYTAAETTINYTFDTATSQGKALSVPLKNKYRYNSMIDYNPVQRKLFAWDNYHIVSYDVRLGRQQ